MRAGEKAASPWFRHITQRSLLLFIAKEKNAFPITEYPCALAGKTAGGIRFSLIFLFLFPSREKEKKRNKE
jgi:hypothetical protein